MSSTTVWKSVQNITPKLLPIVEKARSLQIQYKNDPNVNIEIEARLGKYKNNQFVPGVSEEFFTSFNQYMNNQKIWKNINPFIETHEYLYTYNNINYKSIIEFHENISYNTILQKEKIMNIDLPITFTGINEHAYDVRFSLSKETLIQNAQEILPPMIEPNHMRIKQRQSFQLQQFYDTNQSPIWSYDLTTVWSGKSKSEAEQNQRGLNTIYEIELEIINLIFLLSMKNDTYITQSLLLKAGDIASPKDIFYK